jgi:hypothetical protein
MPQPFPGTAWRHHTPGGFSNSLMVRVLQHIMQVPHALPDTMCGDAEGSISRDPLAIDSASEATAFSGRFEPAARLFAGAPDRPEIRPFKRFALSGGAARDIVRSRPAGSLQSGKKRSGKKAFNCWAGILGNERSVASAQ